MAKDMLINVSEGEECRIALVEDGRLEELYMERTSSTSHVGNVYKGKVTNVEASIQAAFIDFGIGRNGFLHISDLLPTYFGRKGEDIEEFVGKKMARRDRPPIQRCLRRGDEIVVQVIKEGIGTKGPTLSSYLSISGRMLVMMPGVTGKGVSRKIEDDDERRRLRQIFDQLDAPEDCGFIIRTEATGKTKADIERDLKYLARLWEQCKKKMASGPGPMQLYTEGDLVSRTVRDVFTSDVDRIIVDNEDVARRVGDVIRIATPRAKERVELYDEPIPLFHKHGIEKEIELMYSRHVPLPSGGSLVIDQTEAVVAIDVNSGKNRENNDAEMTAFKTDMEAADEICRQLKLRDMGGVIICDFIDLRYERHRRELEKKLHDLLKKDRAKTRVLRMSEFGIIEMTRQRMRPSIKRSVYHDCPHCKGAGLVKTVESMSLDAMRRLAIAISDQKVFRAELSVNPEVAFYLQNKKRFQIADLEMHFKKRIVIKSDSTVGLDDMKLELYDNREGLIYLPELEPVQQGSHPHRTQLSGGRRQQQGGRGGRGDGQQGRGRGDDRRRHPEERSEEDLLEDRVLQDDEMEPQDQNESTQDREPDSDEHDDSHEPMESGREQRDDRPRRDDRPQGRGDRNRDDRSRDNRGQGRRDEPRRDDQARRDERGRQDQGRRDERQQVPADRGVNRDDRNQRDDRGPRDDRNQRNDRDQRDNRGPRDDRNQRNDREQRDDRGPRDDRNRGAQQPNRQADPRRDAGLPQHPNAGNGPEGSPGEGEQGEPGEGGRRRRRRRRRRGRGRGGQDQLQPGQGEFAAGPDDQNGPRDGEESFADERGEFGDEQDRFDPEDRRDEQFAEADRSGPGNEEDDDSFDMGEAPQPIEPDDEPASAEGSREADETESDAETADPTLFAGQSSRPENGDAVVEEPVIEADAQGRMTESVEQTAYKKAGKRGGKTTAAKAPKGRGKKKPAAEEAAPAEPAPKKSGRSRGGAKAAGAAKAPAKGRGRGRKPAADEPAPSETPPADQGRIEAADAPKVKIAPEVAPTAKRGTGDRHLVEENDDHDVVLHPEPPRRPRSFRDLDAIPDDLDD